MHFPRNEPKHHNYEQDKNAATQGSDAVLLNDSDPVPLNSHGVVKDCIVKVILLIHMVALLIQARFAHLRSMASELCSQNHPAGAWKYQQIQKSLRVQNIDYYQ